MSDSTKTKLAVFWVRRDFRLGDNPALSHAVSFARDAGADFLPIFALDPDILNPAGNIGFPRRFMLSLILAQFAWQFPSFLIVQGKPQDVFARLAERFQLHLFLNSDIEPYAKVRDAAVIQEIRKRGGEVSVFRDQTIVDPDTVKTGNGGLYSVFTPFRNAVWDQFTRAPVLPETDLSNFRSLSATNLIPDFGRDLITLQPTEQFNQVQELEKALFERLNAEWICQVSPGFALNLDVSLTRPDLSGWYSTEKQALAQYSEFLQQGMGAYKINRDQLSLEGGTSRMSLALKWGLVSPRQLVSLILDNQTLGQGQESFISELIWREFYKYILYHHPQVLELEFNPRYRSDETYNRTLWVREDLAKARFQAWAKGETGYAIVDAGMRQMHQTGWMHNRARMIVGSFLTKNLGVDWRWGENLFKAMLVDHDEASNNGGWQWSASVGADPKPVRIFNPFIQAEKFDHDGAYRRKWLPEDYAIQEIVHYPTSRQEALERYKLF